MTVTLAPCENMFKLSLPELPEFGWMEAPMDLELFEQALSPLFDDSFLVEPSIPETLPYNQVTFIFNLLEKKYHYISLFYHLSSNERLSLLLA